MIAFAEEHDIDLGDASTKDEIAQVISESEETQPADDETEDDEAAPDEEEAPATGGDVDVADLDDTEYEGEFSPPLTVEDWVVLDGSHEDVPDELDGHIAYVVNAPSKPAPDADPDSLNAARVPNDDRGITVRTRDDHNSTLTLPREAFKAVGRGGRNAVLPIA